MSVYRDLLEPGGAANHPNGPAHNPGPPRMSVPKMGVRARIAEWPPRREQSRESLLENGHGGAGLVRGGVVRMPLPQRRSRDAEFFSEGPRMGPATVFQPMPLRQRSNSEVTLSEQEEAEPEGRGMGLFHREYGSTSSIDVQAVPEQSFFDMLSQFHQERPDQRSPAPARLGELLRAQEAPASAPPTSSQLRPDDSGGGSFPRVRKKSGGTESSLGTSSLFRKLRSASRAEVESGGRGEDDGRPPEDAVGGRAWLCPRSFTHYDVQSLLFDLHQVAAQRASDHAQPRNTPTGASAASRAAAARDAPEPGNDPPSSEDPRPLRELPAATQGPDMDDCGLGAVPLLLGCPHFRCETGGQGERSVSFLRPATERALTLRRSNASVSVLEAEPEQQLGRLDALRHYSIEHVDLGARYYREHFHGKEHWDYFGTDEKLGPVALSIRREKLEDTKELKDQYQYRIILRTSQLVTLRGSVLEDAVPSTARHGGVRTLPLKEVLEHVVPELSLGSLRLALNVPKAPEQLLKLDEQGLSEKHKVGILLCRAGQSTEEEMYNNEEATPAFQKFLELLGEQVCLRGFTKYAAQLDTKTDSTGTHSLYTAYQNYELMFHVSTMLPYMPNNPQQLLRKRHIGNDIVTIIFQEPGALPFTPQNIRSHFQHVFIIVRVHNPCSDSTCYSVAVSRMQDVPPFGPPIPSGATFRDPAQFRDFLLAKAINAENAAHKSEKFHAMATRTRQEYLRDLAENCSSSTPLDSAGKLNNLISLASKRRERARAREGAELGAAGGVAWRALAQDFGSGGGGAELTCVLAVSAEYVVLLDTASKEVVFNCFCADVIGWTPERLSLKVYFGRGDHIAIRVPEGHAQDLREVVTRLKAVTMGCETVEMTLRRNGLGQLGFHVRVDGTVAEVEEYGFAWQAGLRQGSRLVEICKVAAVSLSHEQMIDLLRTSVTVKVLIIPPFEQAGPRRGCTEEYEMKTFEQKTEAEPLAAGYRPPHRPPGWRWESSPGTHSAPPLQRWTPVGPPQPPGRPHKAMVPVPYREPQHLTKRPVSYPENHYSLSPMGGDRVLPYRNPSASFSTPGMGGPFVRYKPSPDRYSTPQRPLVSYEPHVSLDLTSSGESSSGFTSLQSTMERCKTEPLWHIPGPSRVPPQGGAGGQKRPGRQDVSGKDSPSRHLKGEAQYSSHSSSNTLSSNGSSSHSDERWGTGPAELDPPDPLAKGGSNDSGIDATPLYAPKAPPPKAMHTSATYSGLQELVGSAHSAEAANRRRESSPAVPMPANQNKGYRTRTFPLPSAHNDAYKHRACYTPQGYKTPSADKPRPVRPTTVTPTSGQSSAQQQLSSSAPKSFQSKSKHSTWQQREDSGTVNSSSNTANSSTNMANSSANSASSAKPSAATNSSSDSNSSGSKRQVNVFGQPRLRASLRDLRSPRRSHKSTVEDDLKKLIIMDTPTDTPLRDAVRDEASPRRSLQRTFSDESLCSGRRDDGLASTPPSDSQSAGSDLLFTCTLPTRRHAHPSTQGSLLASKKVPLSASELSLTEVRDKGSPMRRLDPGLMPLPDTACGLEWNSLVNAAKAFEVQRAVSLFSLAESQPGGAELQPAVSPVPYPQTPRSTPTLSSDEVSGDLSGRLYHLEVMLKQLNSDLEKEKQDKVALLAEMASLRENNQRLQEESLSASEQLRKFSQMLTGPSADRK